MPLFFYKMRQNRGYRRWDFYDTKSRENNLACGLYFVTKCDKMETTGETIFMALKLVKSTSPVASIFIEFLQQK
jgi:hypothetical protein